MTSTDHKSGSAINKEGKRSPNRRCIISIHNLLDPQI